MNAVVHIILIYITCFVSKLIILTREAQRSFPPPPPVPLQCLATERLGSCLEPSYLQGGAALRLLLPGWTSCCFAAKLNKTSCLVLSWRVPGWSREVCLWSVKKSVRLLCSVNNIIGWSKWKAEWESEAGSCRSLPSLCIICLPWRHSSWPVGALGSKLLVSGAGLSCASCEIFAYVRSGTGGWAWLLFCLAWTWAGREVDLGKTHSTWIRAAFISCDF